jgi:phosphopantothenoylcysteine decarboxylase/phosphopantothenate--cysteine ligase
MNGVLAGKRIILGVTGSIAAYKAIGLVRRLTEDGACVFVVMTDSARQLIGPLTFEVLSGHPVAIDIFAGHQDMKHLSLAEQADLFLVAPCTANTLAKLALGLADTLLGTLALTVQCPLMICPAMDGEMWAHPAVQSHADSLRHRGAVLVEPEVGALASGAWGQGRLASEETIMSMAVSLLQRRSDWKGERLLISAGPTHEPIDPVRFISNGSSGKMGFALAEAASARGAEVVLVTGPTGLTASKQVAVVPVITAEEMLQALTSRFEWATTLVMAAAVGDFRPRHPATHKIKKEQWHGEGLVLEKTPDILLALSAQRTHQRLVGFAAETDHLLEHGQVKLIDKHVDMLVVNQIGGEQSAFGNDTNEVFLLTPDAAPHHIPRMTKRQLADVLLDRMLSLPGQFSHQNDVSSSTP